MKTILIYGDSNSWGFDPRTKERYSRDIRWTWVLRRQLGEEFEVIDEALNGRTIAQDDSLEPGRNGATYLLPCLLSHKPIDLIILMLGTNNLKDRFSLSAFDIAKGIGLLIQIIKKSETGPNGSAPKVLVLAPPPLGPLSEFAESFIHGTSKSEQLGEHFQRVAAEQNCEYLDTSKLIVSSHVDGVHFDPVEHRKLGEAVAKNVLEIIQ